MSNKIRILVVDDNDELRGCLIDYLSQEPGFSIAGEAATGLEALFGYLYLTGQEGRIAELFDIAVPMG